MSETKNTELLQLIEKVELVASSEELEAAKMAVRENAPDSTVMARKALSTLFKDVVVRPAADEAIKAFGELRDSVKRACNKMEQLEFQISESLETFLFPGTLTERYEK